MASLSTVSNVTSVFANDSQDGIDVCLLGLILQRLLAKNIAIQGVKLTDLVLAQELGVWFEPSVSRSGELDCFEDPLVIENMRWNRPSNDRKQLFKKPIIVVAKEVIERMSVNIFIALCNSVMQLVSVIIDFILLVPFRRQVFVELIFAMLNVTSEARVV